ncbi:uncharacterized protein LOC113777087 [Coffea eugenioides]|uniref:uncharacterized protein LOC113777087 n=1 Tax=Coffea eugenioides TaxID=49369 RepID=UPI000F5CEDBA|nr:uncharacterized protein LOC113700734 [Coffea arabica]XP_027177933.1 uncharacterized protein LOC113777087 [Coffea eugenioides]
MPLNCNIKRVEELISGYRWRKPLVFRTFNRKDAEEILEIPISISGKDDSNYWVHSANGIYTVNSRYKVLCRGTTQQKGRRENEAETSIASSYEKQWKWMWRLNIKSKIKHFIWKCLHGLLPVNGLVFKRTHKGDPICDGCGEQEESIEHMIDGREHIELTMNILWQLWKRRNEWKFNAKQRHPWQTVQNAQQEWQEQATDQSKQKMTLEDAERDEVEVDPEEAGRNESQIRISTKVQEQSNRVGMGFIASNFNNQLVAAWALIDKKIGNQMQSTAEAVKMAIIKARQQQWKEIIVHIPNSQLLKMITERMDKDIKMATVIDDINDLRSLF